MEVGIRLRDREKIPMATTPPIQDNAPPTSTSVSNQHREAEHRGLELLSEPGSYPRRILVEDGDNMLEGDGGQDERPQQTFSPLSAKPAGEATPSPTAGCHTQSLRSASTTECIARNKTLLSKLRKIVLRGIQKETEDLIEKGETIQQKIQGFYLNCTVCPVGGAQPDDEDVFDVIIGILKKNQQPETKARTIVNLSDRLYAGLGWQLQHAVLTHHETEESIAGDDGCSDSGLGTSMIESQPSEDPRKFVKPASGAKPPQGTKRKRVHSNQSMRAPFLASSSQSLTTQRPEIATDKNCYFENCKRTEKITTSNQQHKHYLTHYPKKAALCPFIDRYGNICSRVFDSEHYKSNLPKHLRDEHNVDRSILESSKFRNEYLNPRLLISIPDRFHHTCLFCSETFTDAKSSRDHILRHEKTEPVEVLDQAYLEYGAKCTNHKLCGTEEYWKSSEPIQRAIRARRPLPWPPMILSGAETGGTASQPSDHFLAGTTSDYGHTMRDGSYGTPFTSSNGSSYYPQPSPSGYQTPYDELSRQNIQYLTTAINAPTPPPRMPMERWGRETIRDEPWNHLADATIQQEPPWDEIAPAYIANELAHSLENMTIGVPRVGDEENCSTNDSDVSSTGDGLGMMWNPTC
ncbi:hypothetical protein DL95DRAFT_396199 [Leptodontidium sp. 2 PMI_412]|nr:hypothetical protein DL95DRAFT_396199 [Leptodontidium sp. 2 PMI_412]